jgi:hypothetical protein
MKHGSFCEKLFLAIARLCIVFGCSTVGVAQNANNSSVVSPITQQGQECITAAKKILGEHAEVLKCGVLNDANVLESVAILRAVNTSDRRSGVDISQLVVLRREASGWKVALSVSKQIKNQAGFIGIDYIDDSAPFYGYRVVLADQRDDGKKAFVLNFSYLLKGGKKDTEALPTQIAWDKSVGRYREFGINSDPEGFKPEIKNPPHLKH